MGRGLTAEPTRTLTLWCPDWPLHGVGPEPAPSDTPIAILVGDFVLTSTPAARQAGVRRGLRRREAQRRCPGLVLLDRDENAEMRAFEPILSMLEEVCPTVEVVRPGLALFRAKGPSRYFGGDAALAEKVARTLTPFDVPLRIGIAGGPFAAELAARRSPLPERPTIVAPGTTPAFLAPFPVHVLDRPELTHLLVRLGLKTLGQFAELPSQKVASRFGADGLRMHRLARGEEEHLILPRTPAGEISIRKELDPPEERIEPLAFVAKMLADQLHHELGQRGLGCTRLLVEAESEHGEKHSRQWRHDQNLTAAAIAQRIRWQLDGWLTGPSDVRPTAGITLLSLTPSGLHQEDGEQLRLVGGPTGADTRALAAITRLQGILGFDAVCGAVEGTGRSPGSYVELIPWEEKQQLAAPKRPPKADATVPWPGRLPAPHPTLLYPAPLTATVLDDRQELITLSDRGIISAVPQAVSISHGNPVRVINWSGPWLASERWWEPNAPAPAARFQLVTADQAATLVVHRDARWWIEGRYE